MQKLDLKKEHKPLYSASAKTVAFVDVPDFQYLMINGAGDPNGAEFQNAVQTLYAIAYTLKFMMKKGKPAIDYPVMPLEGLWWMQDMRAFSIENKDKWLWTAMIMTPPVITEALVNTAKSEAAKKRELPSAAALALRTYHEGKCAQIMHVGPYATEPATIARMHDAIRAAGFTPAGKHHEIYMGDPRRTKPERLKTILRQPVLAGQD